MDPAKADGVSHQIIRVPKISNRREEADNHVAEQARLQTDREVIEKRLALAGARRFFNAS